MTPRKALQEASKRAGGDAALAELLGVTRQAVDQWKRVPQHHVLTVERLTGVPRHVQRPDIYPQEEA